MVVQFQRFFICKQPDKPLRNEKTKKGWPCGAIPSWFIWLVIISCG